jgi:hypothetical protein
MWLGSGDPGENTRMGDCDDDSWLLPGLLLLFFLPFD